LTNNAAGVFRLPVAGPNALGKARRPVAGGRRTRPIRTIAEGICHASGGTCEHNMLARIATRSTTLAKRSGRPRPAGFRDGQLRFGLTKCRETVTRCRRGVILWMGPTAWDSVGVKDARLCAVSCIVVHEALPALNARTPQTRGRCLFAFYVSATFARAHAPPNFTLTDCESEHHPNP
jgi:hypothetical protein